MQLTDSNTPSRSIEVECLFCNVKFYKRRNQAKRSPNHFCSRSCSVSFNNKLCPKRSLTRICNHKDCNSIIRNKQSSLCEIHWLEYNESKRGARK